MSASAGGKPFELVEDGTGRSGGYRGRDRRRIRPRIGVSERLAEARRGAWAASHSMSALLCPLGYLLLEAAGQALVLAYLTGVARAASKY